MVGDSAFAVSYSLCPVSQANFASSEAACVIVLVVSVCPSVCLSDDNFRKHGRRKFIFARRWAIYLQGIWVQFVYQGHQVKINVTVAKTSKISIFAM